MYEMKDEYLTGIEEIDIEHKQLFNIAENIYQLLHEDFLSDKYDQLHTILLELKDYAMQHLANEEAYMESINYKRMFTQKVQHDAFRNKLEEIDIYHLGDSEEAENAAIQDLLDFVTNWLIHHILENDILIGQA